MRHGRKRVAERKTEKQTAKETDMFCDRQSQIAERKTGDGWGAGDHSREAE